MGRHTWYLGEESVVLVFFVPRVSLEIESAMTVSLEKEVDGHPPKKPKLVDLASLQLLDLVTARIKRFFKIMEPKSGVWRRCHRIEPVIHPSRLQRSLYLPLVWSKTGPNSA